MKHDDAIAELKAEVVKLKNDNKESKQQTQNISFREVVNIPNSVVDQHNASEVSSKICASKQKTLEDKETDAFLNKGLIREIISSKEEKHVTEISANLVCPNNDRERNGDIISLYKNTCDEIEANREETLRWHFYARDFKSMYKDFMVSNKVGKKKTKGQVYDFIIKQLPDTKHKTLCKESEVKSLAVSISMESVSTDLGILPDTEVSASSSDTKKTLLETEVSTIIIPSILSSHISNSEDNINEDVKSLSDDLLDSNSESSDDGEENMDVPITMINTIMKRIRKIQLSDGNDDYYGISDEYLCPLCKLDHYEDYGIKADIKLDPILLNVNSVELKLR
ncbi:hypothetical protein Glove_707g49 [Diversispora epigaea]|uniref:Uncharacterized protein n=1 Tax=Diversispora epigaea TaxID=1348612 RepID=A0A397G481_9GLOM|nr:hypothetical protein Glove_707g49 [Diversispora epigaea]